MSTALAVQSTSFQQLEAMAARLAKSGLVPDTLRNKPDDVLVILMTGIELGLQPMRAIQSIYVVKGRPIMSADLIVGVCVRYPDVCRYFRLVESTAERATYETHRVGAPEPVRLTFTIKDAERAGLTGSQTWKSYPAAMLRHRCGAALARDTYPDLVAGIYEEDEGREMAKETVRVEVREPAPEPKALPPPQPLLTLESVRATMAKVTTAEELLALSKDISRLPMADKEALRADYAKRKAELTTPAQAPVAATEVAS